MGRRYGLQYGELIPRPEKIICAGLNYRAHIVETGRNLDDWTDYPMLFAKFWRSLLGPTDDLVVPDNSDRVDWEAELAVVVGRDLYHGDEDEALAAIAGYTVINDVSMRDWQIRTPEMLQGKTFERCTPVGPALVTGDEIDDGTNVRVTCIVDDVVMQDAFTSDMIFSPAQLVAYASQFVTLRRATSSPPGHLAESEPGRSRRSIWCPGRRCAPRWKASASWSTTASLRRLDSPVSTGRDVSYLQVTFDLEFQTFARFEHSMAQIVPALAASGWILRSALRNITGNICLASHLWQLPADDPLRSAEGRLAGEPARAE